MDATEENIARALASGDPAVQDEVIKQETLRFAVQRVIMCPYSNTLLDVRKTVVLDGSDHGGKVDIMHADVYEVLLMKLRAANAEAPLDELRQKLGYEFEVLDGRELWS